MNSFIICCSVFLLLLSCSPQQSSTSVSAQPISDTSGLGHFYELLNPRWRQHRATLRPFVERWGSPVFTIRGTRSVKEFKKPSAENPMAQCSFFAGALYCAGVTGPNSEATMMGCYADADFGQNSTLKLQDFALSDVRVIKQMVRENQESTPEPIVKVFLYPKEEKQTWYNDYVAPPQKNQNETSKVKMFSIHSKFDKRVTDLGIKVIGTECWKNMASFFRSLVVKDEIMVKKDQKSILPVNSIGTMQVVDRPF